MKIQFNGTLEEFTTVFRGLVIDFDLDEEEDEFVEESLSYRGSGPSSPVKEIVGMRVDTPPDLPTGDKEAIPFPQNKLANSGMKKITAKERAGVLVAATEFFCAWVVGFGDEEAEQPNRIDLTESMGSGQWTVPFLVLCYEYGSLQKFCGVCLEATHRARFSSQAEWWKWIDLVACNIVQVSVAGFPDVQGTYDYSTRWKREALGEK